MNAEERATLKAAIQQRLHERVAADFIEPGKVDLPLPGTPIGTTGRVTRIEHGTEAAYVQYRCRCAACKNAASEARTRRRNANIERERERERNYKRAKAAEKRGAER